MSYSHLSIIERGQLETLRSLGWSVRAIARQLCRHPSTIARELNRGAQAKQAYEAASSQKAYEDRRRASRPHGKFTVQLAKELEARLDQTWSPEQIAEKRRVEGKTFVCFKTIYRWIYSGRLAAGKVQVLRHKGKRRGPVETRGRFLVGTPISQRPHEIRKRSTFGHWELDTVVSSRGKSKACVATFIERKTRLYLAVKMPDRTAYSMEVACGVVASQYPHSAFQSATVDRGKEFACYSSLEHYLQMKVYFADPYSSWQRGSNENGNGLLREFFPKGHDFATVTDQELAQAVRLINFRPRKSLGWKSAHEAFMDEMSHLA
ncbi:transposase, IS30 family [Paenibacillus sophorae]|uniref:IS30 family transposase n=1 Tax=Paenibacillus sophorae TaxID=1333845 RepID=A0A1H8TT84_9BACL|nr:IS30 family transposase [Paenibacillus sophorae]QWU17610.1 IS30 family transposase [Paenibacillus sophorae]QWU18002.1 IS30 family transposase [Paenibacillus sophorae]SEO10430.1 transposase, IS30 family [Paenibacillus sophorae]SEO93638.1 transposase, IS30 family [Paenibacillus sophorae]SEO99532.1 transposase, IS30 family [Paenibacillus sophorae]